MKKLILTAAAAMLFTYSTTAQASFIGFNALSDGSGCPDVHNISLFQPFNIYVVAQLYFDAAANGITGAEFRVVGMDPAWFVTVTPNPMAALAIGNPIDPNFGGCNIAFATCQGGASSYSSVLLYTFQIFPLAPIHNRVLTIARHTTPSNPNFMCPSVTLCDAPVFTQMCVLGGQGGVNLDCYCDCIAVEAATWSKVKSLYGSR